MTGTPQTISVSLVSHTNAGKTTLARTLLGQDIGEVRDAPHVTEFAEVHTMLKTPEGDGCSLGHARIFEQCSADAAFKPELELTAGS
jgi:hypothetical protein